MVKAGEEEVGKAARELGFEIGAAVVVGEGRSAVVAVAEVLITLAVFDGVASPFELAVVVGTEFDEPSSGGESAMRARTELELNTPAA